jgi:hypothetical protein
MRGDKEDLNNKNLHSFNKTTVNMINDQSEGLNQPSGELTDCKRARLLMEYLSNLKQYKYNLEGATKHGIISVNQSNLSLENKQFLIGVIIKNPACNAYTQLYIETNDVPNLINVNISKELLSMLESEANKC